MQLQGLRTNEEARFAPVPRSTPFRPGSGRLGATAGAGPASAARCFATFSSRNARLFAGEFVRSPLLVGCASALRRNRALGLGIHRRETARRLTTDTAGVSRVRRAVVSAAVRSASRSAASASLVHPIPLVVRLVRHYRSPCRDIRLLRSRLLNVHRVSDDSVLARAASEYKPLMRKHEAANSGRGRTAPQSGKLWISSLLSRV